MPRSQPFGESAYVQSIVVGLEHSTDVSEARRQVAVLAGELGFNETDAGRIAIITTELAMNVVLHGRGGEILCRAVRGPAPELELLAVDKGPGMADFPRFRRDGFSTTGTAGVGLGAICRLATDYDIFTAPGLGTAMMARVRSERAARRTTVFEVGAVCVAKPGEDVCGDGWASYETADSLLLTLVDGLGHGPHAAAAAEAALNVLSRRPTRPFDPNAMTTFLEDAHSALRATRGAALSLALVNLQSRQLHFLGVGNVMGTVAAEGQTKGLVPRNGTLGLSLRPAPPFAYEWPTDGLLLMHSDGMASHLKLEKYPGLTSCHPAVIAGVLYRDFRRGTDDATIAVARAARRLDSA